MAKDKYRRALEALAEANDGCTDHLLQILGFNDDLIGELIRAELASAEAMATMGDRTGFNIRRIRITDTGRQALARRR